MKLHNKLLVSFVILKIADGITTIVALSGSDQTREAIPLTKTAIDSLGLTGGVTAVVIGSVIAIPLVVETISRLTHGDAERIAGYGTASVMLGAIVANNLYVIWAVVI